MSQPPSLAHCPWGSAVVGTMDLKNLPYNSLQVKYHLCGTAEELWDL